MKAFMIEDTRFAGFIEVKSRRSAALPLSKYKLSQLVYVEQILKFMRDIILNPWDKKGFPDMSLRGLSQR